MTSPEPEKAVPVAAAEKAIREALEAWPTPGPWIGAGPSFGDPFPRYTTEIVQDRQDDDECEETICVFEVSERIAENEANALLIAACNPVAMTILLDHLSALRAEVERLRAVLIETRRVLGVENEKGLSSAIQDTIWRGPAETLFDYIDAAITAAHGAQGDATPLGGRDL